MTLREYINSFPMLERPLIRRLLAEAQGCTEVTVHAWCNGNQNHPPSIKSIEITERFTDNKVTRYDLRPDLYGEAKVFYGIGGLETMIVKLRKN